LVMKLMVSKLEVALKTYYKKHGISALNFKCPHFKKCKSDCAKFSTAKEANLGVKYGRQGVPKLLFLSLDPGYSSAKPKNKTLQKVREIDLNADLKISNIHWRRTLEFAWVVLLGLKDTMNLKLSSDVTNNASIPFKELYQTGKAKAILPYIAHTNSAKCSMQKEGKKQADARLFTNCREYILGEIRLLDPDILVTQGKFAHRVIDKAITEGKIRPVNKGRTISGAEYKVNGTYTKTDYQEIVFTDRPEKRLIWIRHYHPSNYGKFPKNWKAYYPQYGYADRIAKDLISKRQTA